MSTWFGLTSIHGVPVVNPAPGEASHCIGVRGVVAVHRAHRGDHRARVGTPATAWA